MKKTVFFGLLVILLVFGVTGYILAQNRGIIWWPEGFCPYNSSGDYSSQDYGSYSANNGYSFTFTNLFASAGGGEGTLVIRDSNNRDHYYLLNSVSGKVITVKVIQRNTLTPPPNLGRIYTLCTNYTMVWVDGDYRLTLSGGNVPGFSGVTMTLINPN